ncbi:MAG: hypothetical protein Q4D79_09155 [Propionibacteriaceae bacterium]|nr:hypothetical protein [Propionibacteriaceae bacterium]
MYTRNTKTTPWFKEAFSRDFFIRLNLAVDLVCPASPLPLALSTVPGRAYL